MTQQAIRYLIKIGLIAGLAAVSVSAIGMVEAFDDRDLITGVLTLGQGLLFTPAIIAGFVGARQFEETDRIRAMVSGVLTGLATALPVIGLVLLATYFPEIRNFAEGKYGLTNVTAALVEILTFGQGTSGGVLLLAGLLTAAGGIGALVHILPHRFERPLVYGALGTLVLMMFSDLVQGVLRPVLGTSGLRVIYGTTGMKPLPALISFIVITALSALWRLRGRQAMQERMAAQEPVQQQRARLVGFVLLLLLLLVLPSILGRQLTNVMDTVGIYILMGLGLNIVVGFAGLLDLGYVAFFAIGAYTMGILTSQGALGISDLTFWTALPIAVAAAVLAGLLLGTPVLRMRGDYLAIVTLGFGEIIRILAQSDLLKPYIGGAQGILQLPSPRIFGFEFLQPQHYYYLILAGCALVAFVSWRLRDARLGRQWMAMREDEDVAEAMGIHLVKTKLLAFGIGAAFSGLAGAISATRIGSIFPHSFDLLISINVLSLIIVGGIGSLPGVVVGAFVLVGMPELLREFESYRLLIYGALLITTMIARPEGLWPSPVRRRELHVDEVPETFPSEEGLEPFTEEPLAEPISEAPTAATE